MQDLMLILNTNQLGKVLFWYLFKFYLTCSVLMHYMLEVCSIKIAFHVFQSPLLSLCISHIQTFRRKGKFAKVMKALVIPIHCLAHLIASFS
jgi:hypothetical protein